MALISILLANLWLMIVLISSIIAFVLFTISMILFLKKKKSQNGEKTGNKKISAIITLVISIIFLIPLGITLVGISIVDINQELKDKEAFEAVENKVGVRRNEWKEGFDYYGKHLIPVSIFINSDNYYSYGKFCNLKEIGAITMENSYDFYQLYEIENDSGYKIYYVQVTGSFVGGEYYSRTFVDENDYDEILNYYSTANLSVSAIWRTAPENTELRRNWKKLDLNISDKRDKLIKLSREVLDDVSDKRQTSPSDRNDYNCMSFKIKSDDGVLTIDLTIYTKNDEMILYLNEYKVESEIVEKYKDMLFSLINDSQTELLQKNDM